MISVTIRNCAYTYFVNKAISSNIPVVILDFLPVPAAAKSVNTVINAPCISSIGCAAYSVIIGEVIDRTKAIKPAVHAAPGAALLRAAHIVAAIVPTQKINDNKRDDKKDGPPMKNKTARIHE